jgi:uncharacterized protein (UPF0276 family)
MIGAWAKIASANTGRASIIAGAAGNPPRRLNRCGEVAEGADCAILLDINNIHVSSVNHGFDPEA